MPCGSNCITDIVRWFFPVSSHTSDTHISSGQKVGTQTVSFQIYSTIIISDVMFKKFSAKSRSGSLAFLMHCQMVWYVSGCKAAFKTGEVHKVENKWGLDFVENFKAICTNWWTQDNKARPESTRIYLGESSGQLLQLRVFYLSYLFTCSRNHG